MENETNEPKWRPIGKVLRRVLGVLVEKAKTTPDVYPMTINAIATASNQKSNRSPKMELTPDDVEDVLEELRGMGAVVEIQSDGRKFKYKHLMYEWLGVDKVQLAVMAELFLRGEQTLGDLRARASRMEKIEGQGELKPIVQELISKNLMIALTPEGRGQIVTHGLYLPEELAKMERQLSESPAVESKSKSASIANPQSQNESSDLHKRFRELSMQVQQLIERVDQLEQERN